MKNVGFVTTPLTSGHSARGVGVYTQNLLFELKKLSSGHNINIVEITTTLDLSKPQLDLIHYPFFDLFYPTLPLIKNLPTVVTIHDITPLKFPAHYPPGLKGQINHLYQLFSLKSVGRVITDSYASVKDLHQYLHLPYEKIKLTYLAVPDSYRPVTDKQNLHQISKKFLLPSKFVLYVGDINYNKNLPLLIKVCLSLNIHLVLVGKNITEINHLDLNHPELTHLKEIIPLLSSPLIHRLGFISEADKIALYSLATLYCQPSLYEGFGLSVLEAMTCGCPVVSSNTSSLPEIGGEAVKYFDPTNFSQAEQLIHLVYTQNKLRTNLIQAGLSQGSKFSWSKTALASLDVYNEIL